MYIVFCWLINGPWLIQTRKSKKIMSPKKVAARSAHLDKCKLADAIKGQQIGKLSMLMSTPRPMKPQKRITPVDAPISPIHTMGTFQSQPGSHVHEKKKKFQCFI